MKQTRNIEVNGQPYTVQFRYDQAIHPRLKKVRQVLVCRIYFGASAPYQGRCGEDGIAYRRPTDPFNEHEGRKAALRRALRLSSHPVEGEQLSAFQRAFLQAFFSKTKREDKPWKPAETYALVSDNLARY